MGNAQYLTEGGSDSVVVLVAHQPDSFLWPLCVVNAQARGEVACWSMKPIVPVSLETA
eukprot:COSAG06_NODE_42717_length_379_cov_0.735714_1_plen_57_part_10